MERLRSLKTVVWMIAALLAVEIIMLAVMIKGFAGLHLWLTVGVIAIMCVYLIRLSLQLIAELKKINLNNEKDSHGSPSA